MSKKKQPEATIKGFEVTSLCPDCGKPSGYVSTLSYSAMPAMTMIPEICMCRWHNITGTYVNGAMVTTVNAVPLTDIKAYCVPPIAMTTIPTREYNALVAENEQLRLRMAQLEAELTIADRRESC